MVLEPAECERFFRLHKALMFFVNRELKVVKKAVKTPAEYAHLTPEDRMNVHRALLDRRDLIDAFVEKNPADLSFDELEEMRTWHDLVAGRFIVFRHLKKHTIFLTMTDPAIAYGVVGLSDPLEELVGPYLPLMLETTLLPFAGRIVYDGLLAGGNISFGSGYRRSFKESYEEAKARTGVVTTLPAPEKPERPKRARKRPAGSKSLRGRWRITWMEQWDQDVVDEEVEGFFEFRAGGRGSFHFIYVQGEIDGRDAERDGRPAVEFTWEGNDEMDRAHGRGWAALKGDDEIEGEVFLHGGDGSRFRARRATGR